MERTTKTFVGGLVIGSIMGGLIAYCVVGTVVLNSFLN